MLCTFVKFRKKKAIVPLRNMSILQSFLLWEFSNKKKTTTTTATAEIVRQGICVCHNAVEAFTHFSSLTLFDKLMLFVIESTFWYENVIK